MSVAPGRPGDRMTLPRRKFLCLAAAAALPAIAGTARAQAYPDRAVRIIVAFPAGNATDIVARLIGQRLSEQLGQSFVIENRPGARGNIGTEVVVRAPSDGYTLLMIAPSAAANATLYDNLNFNFIRDIAPAAGIARAPYVMALSPSVPAKAVPEFIAYARANPGKINMAGNGSLSLMCGELFMMMAGVNMVHVPYRASFLPDLLGGQVQVAFGPISQLIADIRADKLRALAVTTATRSPALPDIPAVAEFVPGYEASGWFGIGAPRSTPAKIIDKLNNEVDVALAEPKVKAQLTDMGAVPMAMTPAEFGTFIAAETEKWGKVVRAANLKPE
jgi:tripartite-type tricarboxylate transporter receptor subunit TctC